MSINSSLCRFTYSSTLPLDINGMIMRGMSLFGHIPISSITLGWLNESIVVSSFNIFLALSSENSAVNNNYYYNTHNYYYYFQEK